MSHINEQDREKAERFTIDEIREGVAPLIESGVECIQCSRLLAYVTDLLAALADERARAEGEPNNLEDYRNAPSGIGPLADEWKDKPHRLLYDLIALASTSYQRGRDEQRQEIERKVATLQRYAR